MRHIGSFIADRGVPKKVPSEWEEFEEKFQFYENEPIYANENRQKKRDMKSFISQVEASARTREREEIRGKIEGLKVKTNEKCLKFEPEICQLCEEAIERKKHNALLDDLLSSLQD